MRISDKREAGLQPCLFAEWSYEARVCTVAACRNYVGDFIEEATAKLLRGQRLKTDCTADICPDVRVTDQCFAESKSIGCSGAIIVYQGRLEKDLAFVAAHQVNLWYVMWQHAFRVEDGIELAAVRSGVAASVRSVVLIPITALSEILKAQPLKVLNSKHTARGYGSHGYNNGYSVRYSVVRDLLPRADLELNLDVYGREVAGFSIYGDLDGFRRSLNA